MSSFRGGVRAFRCVCVLTVRAVLSGGGQRGSVENTEEECDGETGGDVFSVFHAVKRDEGFIGFVSDRLFRGTLF